jgi:hypothetical protein
MPSQCHPPSPKWRAKLAQSAEMVDNCRFKLGGSPERSNRINNRPSVNATICSTAKYHSAARLLSTFVQFLLQWPRIFFQLKMTAQNVGSFQSLRLQAPGKLSSFRYSEAHRLYAIQRSLNNSCAEDSSFVTAALSRKSIQNESGVRGTKHNIVWVNALCLGTVTPLRVNALCGLSTRTESRNLSRQTTIVLKQEIGLQELLALKDSVKPAIKSNRPV